MKVYRLRRMHEARTLQRRGVYLLPSLFTVANIFCGFSAIIMATHGRFVTAAVMILVAGVLDGLDGRIARLTGSTSEFGLQLDSIADTVSFGVAPAYMMYAWGVAPLQRAGWALSFLYVICAASRLARFNIQHKVSDNRYFIGLPTPPAAGVLAGLILCFPEKLADTWFSGLAGGLLLVVSALMVSTIRYRSFKDIGISSRHSYLAVIPIAVILVGILIEPPVVVLALMGLYLLSGPVGMLLPSRRRTHYLPGAQEATRGEEHAQGKPAPGA